MKICFFNLTEPSGGKTGNGVVRVAMVLARELRERGHSVDFYTPPHEDLKKSGVFAGEHFREFLRARKIAVAA